MNVDQVVIFLTPNLAAVTIKSSLR